MKHFVITILTICFLMNIAKSDVLAQEASSSADSDGIFQQETLRPEIERLRVSYRGIIEEYRTKERQYQIAKTDYQQLKTLRSLEEAIKATREVIVSRTDVLLTYFELLKLELQESEGVEQQKKTRAIQQIEDEIIFLRSYKETALAAQDKEQVLELTTIFRDHVQVTRNRGYHTLSLILIGRLQTVHDKSRILQADIESFMKEQQVSNYVRSQRERSFIQTTQSLELVNANLNKELVNLAEDASASSYNNLRDKLSESYTQLSQSISYLKELLVL